MPLKCAYFSGWSDEMHVSEKSEEGGQKFGGRKSILMFNEIYYEGV